MSRLLLRRTCALTSIFQTRTFTSSPRYLAFATGPSPPRLPPKEQEEFERLQKSSTGAFSTPRSSLPSSSTSPVSATTSRVRPQINQSPALSASDSTNGEKIERKEGEGVEEFKARIEAKGKGEELHPDVRRGAKPEFEGERNPKTGESGGPKNEPLRWGSTAERGDWSYNGRVTDF